MNPLPARGELWWYELAVPQGSVLNLDSVEIVSLGTLVERLGRLSDARRREVCRALEVADARGG